MWVKSECVAMKIQESEWRSRESDGSDTAPLTIAVRVERRSANNYLFGFPIVFADVKSGSKRGVNLEPLHVEIFRLLLSVVSFSKSNGCGDTWNIDSCY